MLITMNEIELFFETRTTIATVTGYGHGHVTVVVTSILPVPKKKIDLFFSQIPAGTSALIINNYLLIFGRKYKNYAGHTI